MMKYWKRLSQEACKMRIQASLKENVNFYQDFSLGYPASALDNKVFNEDAPFLKDAPTLQTWVANPNHIGCHTLGTSEKAFKGTQDLEVEVLNCLAVDLFKAEEGSFDGYISPGGTEANIQALWIYRNYFMSLGAKPEEVVIFASEDTHYSIAKGSNLLMIDWVSIAVDPDQRFVLPEALNEAIVSAKAAGKKYAIVVANMGTTMFGSVDQIEVYTHALEQHQMPYKLHVDGAYGGFIYPFSHSESQMNFENPAVSSITIDAHKMLQAPYGTGIFVCRKGLIEHVLTKEAAYVEGMDLTLCGSRSGANAVAVWMVMMTYGPNGWFEKISVLQMRTSWLCRQLDMLGVQYFREPHMNLVTIRAEYISEALAEKYTLVPQSHDANNEWYKIVIMHHVEVEAMTAFLEDLKLDLSLKA
jgi:tyrosine decarboxylase/aspartate 1-decarboxylase